MKRLVETDIPFLPRGVWVKFDAVRNCHVLLGPERALILDPISLAILQSVDGGTSIGNICTDLAEKYQAPLDRILDDTKNYLTELFDKQLLWVKHG